MPITSALLTDIRDLARNAASASQYAVPGWEQQDEIRGLLFLLSVQQIAIAQRQPPPSFVDAARRKQWDRIAADLSELFPSMRSAFERYINACSGTLGFPVFLEQVEKFFEKHRQFEPDILSWFYQEHAQARLRIRKDVEERNDGKIAGHHLRIVTQFFTDEYMVQHLVRRLLSPLVKQVDSPAELRVLDPASGGGNFLTAAFIFLVDAFAGLQSVEDLVDELLTQTLIGYDLESTLAELAQLNLALAATSVLQRLPRVRPNTFGGTPEDERGFLDPNEVARISEKFGSAKRRVILTNPPFLGRRLMSPSLRDYLQQEYPASRGDLCVGFMLQCLDALEEGDCAGFVHQTSWMNLSTFAEAREQLLGGNQLLEVVDLGSNAFANLSGEKARVALSSFRVGQTTGDCRFVRLVNQSYDDKRNLLKSEIPPSLIYNVDDGQLTDDSGEGLHYFVTHQMRVLLYEGPTYGEFATPMQGTSTGDNARFVRYSWQVPAEDREWRLVSKGGGYCKWSGLHRYIIHWGDDGEVIREQPNSAPRNLDVMDNTQLVYSDTGTRGMNVRLMRDDEIFMASGPGIEVIEGDPLSHLAYLNSRVASFFMRVLSPKLTISAGYISRLPFSHELSRDTQLAALARQCVRLKEEEHRRKLGNDEYQFAELDEPGDATTWLEGAIVTDIRQEAQRLQKEYEIEKRVLQLLPLSSLDKQRIYDEVGRCAASFPDASLALDAQELDKTLAKALTPSCQYAAGRKRGGLLGIEGIVEQLAFEHYVSPQSVMHAFDAHRSKLTKAKAIYAGDLAHKFVLDVLGFRADRKWKENSIARCDLLEQLDRFSSSFPHLLDHLGREMTWEHWLDQELPDLHAKAFSQASVLHFDKQVIRLRRTQ